MSNLERFDIIVLGGGKGGKTLAVDMAKAGRTVALVEAGMIGGSCINVACIPSKALIRSAEVAATVAKAHDFGTDLPDWSVDMQHVADRTAAVVAERVGYNRAAFETSGLDLIIGWGRFIAPKVIEVASTTGVRHLTAERIYINLGTRAAMPPIPGLAAAMPMSHVELLKLAEKPARLIVIGGGYVGMEMAHAFRRLGSEVTVLEAGPRLAGREDDDVADAIAALFDDRGIEVATSAVAIAVRGFSGSAVEVETADGRHFSGSHLLIAAGRRPMTSDVGLEVAGVTLSTDGYVIVDEWLRTSVAGIWAIGEVAGSPMFTHASLDDYRVVKSEIEGGGRSTKGRIVPACLFVDPELAHVGLSEKHAQAERIPYRLAKIAMSVVPRARTMSSLRGFMKCLVAADDDSILGFTMLGERAGEVMATMQLAISGRLPYTMLRDAIIAHPTITEGFNLLFEHLVIVEPEEMLIT